MKGEDLKRLDLLKIRELLEQNKKEDELNRMIEMILKHRFDSRDNLTRAHYQRFYKEFYVFLKGLTIPLDLLEKYKGARPIIFLLIDSGCKPYDKIKTMAFESLDIDEIVDLVNEGKIGMQELEDWLIQKDSPRDIGYAIFSVPGLNVERLANSVDELICGLQNDLMALEFFNTDVSEELKSDLYLILAKDLQKSAKNWQSSERLIVEILKQHFDNYFDSKKEAYCDDITDIPSLSLLYEVFHYSIQPKTDNYRYRYAWPLIEKIKIYNQKPANDIADGKVLDIALYFSLFELEEYVPDIINKWVQDGRIAEYEIYSEYLFNADRDYETDGKELDRIYKEHLKSLQEEGTVTLK